VIEPGSAWSLETRTAPTNECGRYESGGPRREKRWMREWCMRTMNSLDEARRRKLRVAMMIPQPEGERNGESQIKAQRRAV